VEKRKKQRKSGGRVQQRRRTNRKSHRPRGPKIYTREERRSLKKRPTGETDEGEAKEGGANGGKSTTSKQDRRSERGKTSSEEDELLTKPGPECWGNHPEKTLDPAETKTNRLTGDLQGKSCREDDPEQGKNGRFLSGQSLGTA